MRVVPSFLLLLLAAPRLNAFVVKRERIKTFHISMSNDLGLTEELEKMTNAFKGIPDEKIRYKQLLFLAAKLEPMDPILKTDKNKVPGCLSTVHVHASLDESTKLVSYSGDSDGQLTKGLVALLVRGLSNNTPEDIQKVQPDFVSESGIGASLTPGRNNGFLNMLAVMKQQAAALQTVTSDNIEEIASRTQSVEEKENTSLRPMYNAIMTSLSMLKPTDLKLTDNSDQHAGHAGSKGFNGESHFELDIVAECFDGLSLVQRHKLIYTILGDAMSKIHALSIKARTPAEVEASKKTQV